MNIPDELALMLTTNAITKHLSDMPTEGAIVTVFKSLHAEGLTTLPFRGKRSRVGGPGYFCFPAVYVRDEIFKQAYRFAQTYIESYGVLRLALGYMEPFKQGFNDGFFDGTPSWPMNPRITHVDFNDKTVNALGTLFKFEPGLVKILLLGGILAFSGTILADGSNINVSNQRIVMQGVDASYITDIVIEHAEDIPRAMGENLLNPNVNDASMRVLIDSAMNRFAQGREAETNPYLRQYRWGPRETITVRGRQHHLMNPLSSITRISRLTRVDREYLQTYILPEEGFDIEKFVISKMELQGHKNIARANAEFEVLLDG